MRVEIVDIGTGDYWYSEKTEFIGEKGTLATEHLWDGGFTGGAIYFDSGRSSLYFHEVKTKPIYDA